MNWGLLAAEFAARRKRLRAAISDWRASLFEFSLLGGMFVGAASPAFGPKGFFGAYFAPALPLLALVGYLAIESARQRALSAGGATEVGLRPAFDQRTLLFLIAVAALGYVTFVWALFAPPPFELVPEEPPPSVLDVTLGAG